MKPKLRILRAAMWALLSSRLALQVTGSWLRVAQSWRNTRSGNCQEFLERKAIASLRLPIKLITQKKVQRQGSRISEARVTLACWREGGGIWCVFWREARASPEAAILPVEIETVY